MEGNSTNPEPNHAIIYVDADGTVTHGVPEDCQVKRSPNFTHKRIGVCVLIYDPERGYVFGKRKGSHGAGESQQEPSRLCIVQDATYLNKKSGIYLQCVTQYSNIFAFVLGKWATPGGHTELEETLEQCVHREVMEETGLKVGEAKFLGFTYDNFIESNGSKASLKNYLTTWWVTRAKPGDNPVVRTKQLHTIWEDGLLTMIL